MEEPKRRTPTIQLSLPELRVNRRFVDDCKKVSIGLLCLVAALGVIETIGWAFGIEWIKRPIANERAMPSGAAILFFLSSVSLFCFSVGKIQTWRKWLGIIIAIFIGIAGGATYLEHVCEKDWSLIYPLYRTSDSTPLTFPGPMMPDVSLNFVFITVALLLFCFKEKIGIKATQTVALLVGLPNLMIFLCYFCGMEHLCAYFGCIKFSPITSLTFVLFCFALILSNPQEGFTSIFMLDTSAGKVSRRLCSLAVMLCSLAPLRMSLVHIGEQIHLADELIINIATAVIGLVSIGGVIAWSLGKFDTAEADISERKQAERLQKEVVQMVSHDLRSPLTSIQAVLEMMQDDMLGNFDDKGKKLVAIADRSASRMLTLINDLLDVEKLDAGMLQLNKSQVSLSSIFEQSIQTVVTTANEKSIKIEALATNVMVYADGDRLVQILVNLLSNALKFSPTGAKVVVAARQLPEYVEITVADQGRGIPAHLTKSIFDRFKQVSSQDAKQQHGTGLGLSICKALVELHGGDIRAESEEGKGSTFYFSLPSSGKDVSPEGPGVAVESGVVTT
jgi:signal transduction histidine kinase